MAKRSYRKKNSGIGSFFQGLLVFLALLILLFTCMGVAAAKFDYAKIHLDLHLPPSSEVDVEYGSDYTRSESTATLTATYRLPGTAEQHTLFQYDNIPIHYTGNVRTDELGSYHEEYVVRLLWVEKRASVTVNVVDSEPPVIELNGSSEITIDQGEEFSDVGFSASDNYDGNVTKEVKVKGEVDNTTCGTYVIDYTVKDSSGNQAHVTRTITVRDTEPPVITLSGDTEMTVSAGKAFEDPGYSVQDNTDSMVDVVVENLPDMSTPGKYEVTYRAEDSSGNVATATRIVYVKADTATTRDPGNKVVYLSFDDGPGPYTQDLLDVLAKYNVKVTFFVTNQFPGYKDMIAKERAAGHTVAIHSYTHDFSKIYTSTDAFFSDIKQMSDLCKEQTGETPTILRFPGGTSNTVSKKYCSGIMTTLTKECDSRGYLYCDWNVDSNDAGGAKTSEEVAQNVINGISSCNVSYVLQHDIKQFSVNAVETIIKWGQENGYTFLPLTTSSPMKHHSVNN